MRKSDERQLKPRKNRKKLTESGGLEEHEAEYTGRTRSASDPKKPPLLAKADDGKESKDKKKKKPQRRDTAPKPSTVSSDSENSWDSTSSSSGEEDKPILVKPSVRRPVRSAAPKTHRRTRSDTEDFHSESKKVMDIKLEGIPKRGDIRTLNLEGLTLRSGPSFNHAKHQSAPDAMNPETLQAEDPQDLHRSHKHALASSTPPAPQPLPGQDFINAIVGNQDPAIIVRSLPAPVLQHAEHIMLHQKMMKGIWHQIFANENDVMVLPAHNFEVRVLLQREVEHKAEIFAHARRSNFGKIEGNKETVFDFLSGNHRIAEEFREYKGVYNLLVAKSVTAAQLINDSNTRLSEIKKRIHSVIGDKKWTEYSRTNSYLSVIDDSLKSYTPENAVYVMKLIGDGRYNKAVAAFVYTSSAMARFGIDQYKKEFEDNEARLKSAYESVESLLEKLVRYDIIEAQEEIDDSKSLKYAATLDFQAMMYIVYDVWHQVIQDQLSKPGNRIRSINNIHPVKLTEQTLNMLSALMHYMIERREVDPGFYFDEDLSNSVINEFRSLISKNLTSASFFSRVFGYLNATQSNLAFASVSPRTLLHQMRFLGQNYIESQMDYGKQDYLIRQRFEKLADDMRAGKFPSVVFFQSLLCELGLIDQKAVGSDTETPSDQRARQELRQGFGDMFQHAAIAREKGEIIEISRTEFLAVLHNIYAVYNKALPRQYKLLKMDARTSAELNTVLKLFCSRQELPEEFVNSLKSVLYELGAIGIESMKDINESAYYNRIKAQVESYVKAHDKYKDTVQLVSDLTSIAGENVRADLDKRAAQIELLKIHSSKIAKDLQEGVFIAQRFFRTVCEVSFAGDTLMSRGHRVEDKELSHIMDIIASDIGSHAGVKATKVEQRMVGLFVTMSKTMVNYLIERFMPQKQHTAFYMALMNLHGFKYVEYTVHRLVAEYQKRVVKEDQKYAVVFEKFQNNIVELFNTGYISPEVSAEGEIEGQDMKCASSMNAYIRILAATMRTLSVFLDPSIKEKRQVEHGLFLNELPQQLEDVQKAEKTVLNQIPPQDRAAIAMAIFNALCEQFMVPEATGALPVKFQHTAITKIAEGIAIEILERLTLQPNGNGTLWLNVNPEELKDMVNRCLKNYIKANDKVKELIRKKNAAEITSSDLSSSESLSSDEEEEITLRKVIARSGDGAESREPLQVFRNAAHHVMAANRMIARSEPTRHNTPDIEKRELPPEMRQQIEQLGLEIVSPAVVSPAQVRKAKESLKHVGNTSHVNIRRSVTGEYRSSIPSPRKTPRTSLSGKRSADNGETQGMEMS